jgi:hypothetical protein
MGFESTELGPTESGQLNGDDFFFTSHHQAKRKSLSTTGCATRVARDGGGAEAGAGSTALDSGLASAASSEFQTLFHSLFLCGPNNLACMQHENLVWNDKKKRT